MGKLHFAWQVLLYTLSTASEILISISGLEYTYAQAPMSMKAVVSSLWLLPVSLGNLVAQEVYVFKCHAWKIHRFNTFFSIFGTLVYIWMAKRYKSVEEEEAEELKRREGKLCEVSTSDCSSKV